MKIIYILGVICIFFSCKHAEHKKSGTENTVLGDRTEFSDSTELFDSANVSNIESPEKESFKSKLTRRVDTVYENIEFRYSVYETDEFLFIEVITGDGQIVKYQYPEVYIVLDLTVNENSVLQGKRITKEFFHEKISKEDISKRQLHFVKLNKISEEAIKFVLNLCVPDTCDCYLLNLFVSLEGTIRYEIIDIDHPGWE